MTIIIEAEHILGSTMPAAFANYIKLYGEDLLPILNDVGFNLIGAWRQITGPLGRDLFLSTADSMAAVEEIGVKLSQHPALQAGLPRLTKLEFTIDEVIKNATPFAFADERRLAQGAVNISAKPRCYRLIRRRVGITGIGVASEALSQLADALEAAGSWQLLTAYHSKTGDRGEMSEVWITDDITRDWYPQITSAETSTHTSTQASIEALKVLDAVTHEASLHLLDPLPFSKAR